MARRVKVEVARKGAGLSSLEPIDSEPFRLAASPGFIWLTVALIWLFSLLPWRVWQPAPDLLLLVIAYWCLNEPRRLGMGTAFSFGLLMDVHDGTLLGVHALTYTLAAYGTLMLSRRLQRFNSVVQCLHMLPVFVIAKSASRLIEGWLAGEWLGWSWLWSAFLMALLWPLADVLLQMPQRRLEEGDGGAV